MHLPVKTNWPAQQAPCMQAGRQLPLLPTSPGRQLPPAPAASWRQRLSSATQQHSVYCSDWGKLEQNVSKLELESNS